MQCFLSSRPKQFSSPEKAIEYMVRSGQVRNLESARVSIVGQIRPVLNVSSDQEIASSTSSSTLASVSHVCESVQEEDEDDDNDETVHKDHHDNNPMSTIHQTVEKSKTDETSAYTWRIDLSKTEPFWQGWFSG